MPCWLIKMAEDQHLEEAIEDAGISEGTHGCWTIERKIRMTLVLL